MISAGLFNLVSLTRSGALLLALLLCASMTPLAAQEEPTKAEKIIAELRAGSWELGKVETLVRSLIHKQHRHAARWWTSQALTAAERGLLPEETGKALEQLAKQEGLKSVEPQLRAMPARAIKHLKQVMSAKCWGEAPQAIHFARRCLELYPDEKFIAEVDEIEASLETIDRKEQRPTSKVIEKSAAKLTDSLGKARDELLADMIEQYDAFPCPPGARAIRALIMARGESEVTPEWRQAYRKLVELEYASEPKLKLRIFCENGGQVNVYRYGEKFVGLHSRSHVGEEKQQGATFEVVAGDVIQFEVKKPHAKKGDRQLFAVAVAAELEGEVLPSRAWFQNANGNVRSLDPLMNPMCRGMEFSPGQIPKGLTTDVETQVAHFGTGLLFPTANEHHHYVLDMHKKIADAVRAFERHGMKPTWIGSEGESLIIALRIPR